MAKKTKIEQDEFHKLLEARDNILRRFLNELGEYELKLFCEYEKAEEILCKHIERGVK